MMHTVLPCILLGLFFLFAITVFKDRAPLWKRLFLLAAPAVCVFCCAVNLEGCWYSSTPHWYEVLSTAIYILFWTTFTLFAHRSRFMTNCCLLVSTLMLSAAVTGLLVRWLSWDIIILPAVLLTPFSTLPMYGLRYFTSWIGLELVSIALSSVWLLYSLTKLSKR